MFEKVILSMKHEDAISFLTARVHEGTLSEEAATRYMSMIREEYVTKHYKHKIWQSEADGRWCSLVEDPSKPKGLKTIKRKEKKDLIEHLYKIMTDDRMTLEKLFPAWIAYKTDLSASSEYPKRIKSDWKRFYEGSELIRIPLRELTSITLERFVVRAIKDNGLTKTAYHNMALILRQSLDYAVAMEYIEYNPFSRVKIDTRRLLRKAEKKPDREQVFTNEEVLAFSRCAWDDFQEPGKKVYRLAPLAALFIFYSGLRVGELTGLRFEDIEDGNIRVRRMVRKDDHKVLDHTKSHADREIPLVPEAMKIIQTCEEFSPGGWIFSEYDRPLPSRIVEEYFLEYCSKIRTPQKSTHCARKTAASALVDNVNINTARRILGHADERTTLKNYVFDRTEAPEKLKKIVFALTYSPSTTEYNKK